MTRINFIEKVLNTMRLLIILIFILSLQTFTKADDIRDFEMEGISIGDSLLDFYLLEQVQNEKKKWFFISQ